MIFGIMTRKEVSEIENNLIESYEAKLSNKNSIIESYVKRVESKDDFIKELQSEISNAQSENVFLKKELEDKERTLRSYYSIFNKINKERGKLYNTKSERIKKKYAKKIDEKLEGM